MSTRRGFFGAPRPVDLNAWRALKARAVRTYLIAHPGGTTAQQLGKAGLPSWCLDYLSTRGFARFTFPLSQGKRRGPAVWFACAPRAIDPTENEQETEIITGDRESGEDEDNEL